MSFLPLSFRPLLSMSGGEGSWAWQGKDHILDLCNSNYHLGAEQAEGGGVGPTLRNITHYAAGLCTTKPPAPHIHRLAMLNFGLRK